MIANIHEAKTQLSRLLERAQAGEEVIIAKAGKPVAKLVPIRAEDAPRQPGALKGRIWMAPDWDEPLHEEIDLASNGPVFPE